MPPKFDEFTDLSISAEHGARVAQAVQATQPTQTVQAPAPMPPANQINTHLPPDALTPGLAPLPAPTQAPTPSPSRLQHRLERLVGQRNDERAARERVELERDHYREQYDLLRTRLESAGPTSHVAPAGAPRHTPSQPGYWGVGDGLAGQGGEAQPQSINVREVVREELRPLTEFINESRRERELRQQRDELVNKQRASLLAAQEEFPELVTPGTEVYRITDQLLRTPRFAYSPDGPYEAALVARGLLAEEARAGQHAQQIRVAATTIDRPTGAGTGLTQSAVPGVQEQYNQVLNAMKTAASPELYVRARRLQRQLLGIEEPQG